MFVIVAVLDKAFENSMIKMVFDHLPAEPEPEIRTEGALVLRRSGADLAEL